MATMIIAVRNSWVRVVDIAWKGDDVDALLIKWRRNHLDYTFHAQFDGISRDTYNGTIYAIPDDDPPDAD